MPAQTFAHFELFIWAQKLKISKSQDDVIPSDVGPNGWGAPLSHNQVAEQTAYNRLVDHFRRVQKMAFQNGPPIKISVTTCIGRGQDTRP